MPTKTIEYTEEVTRQEEVEICSECGKEVDENGDHLEGDVIELDLCSKCIKEYDQNAYESEFVERVEDWYQEEDTAGDTMYHNLKIVKIGSIIGFITGVVIGILTLLPYNLSGLSAVLYGVLLTFVFSNLICAQVLSEPEWLTD